MKKLLASLTLLAAAGSGIAIAENPPAMPDPYADPAAAHEARVGIHRLMATYMQEVGKMVTAKGFEDAGLDIPPGTKSFSGLRMHRMGDHIADLSHMYEEFMFVPGSYEGTAAKPEILENKDDFQGHVHRLYTATQGLQASIRVHDPYGSFSGIVNTIQSCNACHQKYMEPALILPIPEPPVVPGH